MTDKKEKKAAEPTAQDGGQGKALALTADFGTLYCRVQGNDILRPIKADMTLYEKLGHFYSIYSGKEKDEEGGRDKNVYKYAITSSGYVHLNKVAGISILTPQYVIVDGVQQPNPFIEREKRTKAVQAVHVRKIGVGYSPAGSVVVIDKTLFYNTYTYFIQSIQAKMKKLVWKDGKSTDARLYPDAAMIGIEDEKPTKKGRWAFFPTEAPLGIWINYDDQAIIECLDEHTQRQRFGDRIAQKIVERNILKDHPAIGVSNVFAKESTAGKWASVTVYGYRHDMNAPKIAEIMRQAESGAETAPFEIKVEVLPGVEKEVEAEVIEDVAGAEPHSDREPGDDAEPGLFEKGK